MLSIMFVFFITVSNCTPRSLFNDCCKYQPFHSTIVQYWVCFFPGLYFIIFALFPLVPSLLITNAEKSSGGTTGGKEELHALHGHRKIQRRKGKRGLSAIRGTWKTDASRCTLHQ